MASILAPYRTRRHVRVGNEAVVARSRAAGLVAVCVAASTLVAGAAGFASHQDAELLEASVSRLEQARAECRDAETQMQEAYAWAQGRTANLGNGTTEGALGTLRTAMVRAEGSSGVCDAAATSDPQSNDLLAAKFQEAAASALDAQVVLVSARTDVELEDAAAQLEAAQQDYEDARAALESALEAGRENLQSTLDRVDDESASTALQNALGEGATVAGVEVPADADAAWYASQAQEYVVATAKVTSATAGVRTAHEGWLSDAAAESVSGSLVVEIHHEDGDAEDFCAGMNEAREAGGLAPFATCSAESSLVAHAEDMAIDGDIWHSGHDNIVGYASTVPRLVDVFMASPEHHALIMTLGDAVDATVGCAWRHVTGTNTVGATVDSDLVFCAALFTS